MHDIIPKSTLNYIKQVRNKGELNWDNFNDLNRLLETKRLLVSSLIEGEGKKIGLEEKDFFDAEEGQTAGKIKEKFRKYLKPWQKKLEESKKKLEELEKDFAKVSESKLWTSKKSREKKMEELRVGINLWGESIGEIKKEINKIKEVEEQVVYFEKVYWMNVEKGGKLDFQIKKAEKK